MIYELPYNENANEAQPKLSQFLEKNKTKKISFYKNNAVTFSANSITFLERAYWL